MIKERKVRWKNFFKMRTSKHLTHFITFLQHRRVRHFDCHGQKQPFQANNHVNIWGKFNAFIWYQFFVPLGNNRTPQGIATKKT